MLHSLHGLFLTLGGCWSTLGVLFRDVGQRREELSKLALKTSTKTIQKKKVETQVGDYHSI